MGHSEGDGEVTAGISSHLLESNLGTAQSRLGGVEGSRQPDIVMNQG